MRVLDGREAGHRATRSGVSWTRQAGRRSGSASERVAILRSTWLDGDRRADVFSICVGLSDRSGEPGDCQWPREVVIKVHAKDIRTHERALEMMPVVVGHEKLSAMTRVVIECRAKSPDHCRPQAPYHRKSDEGG